jgi:thiamine-monophosphate kinase
LGQFALIDRLAALVAGTRDESQPAWRDLVIGIGDDCAAWDPGGAVQLAHVDCQVNGVHFRPEYGTWRELGGKALAVITSDVAAKGGSPRYALVSLTIPGAMEVTEVTDFYAGLLERAREYGIAVIGGHISGASLFTATIAITGAATGDIPLRSGARLGDQIAVTGTLGGAAAYVATWEKKITLDERSAAVLKKAFLCPQPRIREGRILVKEGIMAAMDISDGLIADLQHICQASRVGALIEAGRVPVNPVTALFFGEKEARGGGEDYELLFTGAAGAIARVRAQCEIPVTVIGEVVAAHPGGIIVIDENGQPVNPGRVGWDHFKGDGHAGGAGQRGS